MEASAVKEMLVVGKVTGCYGLKGWVKIHSYTEPLENFQGFGAWRGRQRGICEAMEIGTLKSHGRGLVTNIAGVDDRSRAESYKGMEVSVPLGA